MRKILLSVLIVIFFFSPEDSLGEEAKEKEKDIYALSYLSGYKCYKAMAGKVMLKDHLIFIRGYKSGFSEAIVISINSSAFDNGFQDARNNYPSKYNEDILKE